MTSLCFDESCSRLASGGKDTHVIVWDVVNECGLFRLKGHKGPITRVRFLKDKTKDEERDIQELGVLLGCGVNLACSLKFWD